MFCDAVFIKTLFLKYCNDNLELKPATVNVYLLAKAKYYSYLFFEG